jgi:hypothetical protein
MLSELNLVIAGRSRTWQEMGSARAVCPDLRPRATAEVQAFVHEGVSGILEPS